MNEIFAYFVAVENMDENENDSQTVENANTNNWKKLKISEKYLDLLFQHHKMFKPVGYKWLFVPKRNEWNEVVRYKARLVDQGFTQRPKINYTETYSLVVDATTLKFLISLLVIELLEKVKSQYWRFWELF